MDRTTANQPETANRSAGNLSRQVGSIASPPKVLQAGKVKMSEMEPGAILEISDAAAQRILEHRATLH